MPTEIFNIKIVEEEKNSAKQALTAAHKLGMQTSSICIKKPFADELPGQGQGKGTPVIGGGVMFKGRAVEKLTEGLPRRPWSELKECPHEDLQSPSRVHVDPYGHIHACQGISLGNIFQVPLSELIRGYNVNSHPICAPLTKGGPAALAGQYSVEHEKEYIDECHFCYSVRLALIDRFPQFLAPKNRSTDFKPSFPLLYRGRQRGLPSLCCNASAAITYSHHYS